MLGIVFTEFVGMVEESFGEEFADDLIESTELSSGGAYTSVGSYDHEELIALVGALCERTGTDADTLIRAFGHRLLNRFLTKYPQFFGKVGLFEFLSTVDNHIHKEVLKLYPSAELPAFVVQQPDDDTFVMVYRSARPFSSLAHGLIEAAIEYFDADVSIDVSTINDAIPSETQFVLRMR